MLSLVLVFGGAGGTVAAADTETDGSVSEEHAPTGAENNVDPTPAASTGATEATVQPAVVETAPTVLPTYEPGALFGVDHEATSGAASARGTEEEPSGPSGPMALGAMTVSQTGTGTDAPATVADDNKGSDTVPADATGQQVNEPDVAVSHSPSTEPSTEPSASPVAADPPATEPPAEEPAVQTVANDVATVEKSSAAVEAAPPVVGPAAAGNLLAVLAYLFIGSPNGDPPLIGLPSSLLSLLGFPLTGEVSLPPVAAGGIGGSLFAGGILTAVRTALASPLSGPVIWPDMVIASGSPRSLSPTGGIVHRSLNGVSASGVKSEHLSLAMADSVVPEQVRSVLRHTIGAVLAPLSLLLLAVTASPGLAGLLLLAAAGTFVGYRQAKAASILRAVGIARFVKAGPLGVVRTGGLVAIRSRTSHAVRPRADQAVASLEPVA